MITNSKKIAGLIGPTIIALALSEMLNFHIWTINIPPLTYLNGTLLFIAGISIIRAHNHWTFSWPLLVTLTGWVLILGGLFRMFAPEAKQASPSTPLYVGLTMFCFIGIFLTFKAYKHTGEN